MSSDFIRRKTSARGGLTPAEREKVDELLRLWASRGSRTTRVNPKKIIRAITGIHKAAGLRRPHVAIAASPLAMAFAYGAALAAWEARNARIKQSRDCEKPDPVLAALKRMTTVIACGDDKNKVFAGPRATPLSTSTRPFWDTRNSTAPFNAERALKQAQREASIAVGSELYKRFPWIERSLLHVQIEDSFSVAITSRHDGSMEQTLRSATARRISVRSALALRHSLESGRDAKSLDAAGGKPRDAGMPVQSRRLASGQPLRGFVRQPSVDEIELLAAEACNAVAGRRGRSAAKRWRTVLQNGLLDRSDLATLTAFRDVLRLELPSHKLLSLWEQAAAEGGVRVVHEEFCIVCDFPEILKLDEWNRPHSMDGPSHRWRDGWALYHWHGIRIPRSWVEDKTSLTPAIALTVRSVEQRRAALEIVGWHNVLRELKTRIVAIDPDPQHGRLVDARLPGNYKPSRFLHVQCATGREFAVGIPRRYRSVKGAHAWLTGLPTRKFKFPTVRT